MNLYILFYPTDDQAQVNFIDFNKLSTSSDVNDQVVCKAINQALLDPDGISTVDAEACCDMTRIGDLRLPCQIDKRITIYLE